MGLVGLVYIIMDQEAEKKAGVCVEGVAEPSQRTYFHQLDPISQRLHSFPKEFC